MEVNSARIKLGTTEQPTSINKNAKSSVPTTNAQNNFSDKVTISAEATQLLEAEISQQNSIQRTEEASAEAAAFNGGGTEPPPVKPGN